jgi:hypothetical protein
MSHGIILVGLSPSYVSSGASRFCSSLFINRYLAAGSALDNFSSQVTRPDFFFWPPDLHDKTSYGWIPHNAGFGFLDLAPSILHSNWFWDYIS